MTKEGGLDHLNGEFEMRSLVVTAFAAMCLSGAFAAPAAAAARPSKPVLPPRSRSPASSRTAAISRPCRPGKAASRQPSPALKNSWPRVSRSQASKPRPPVNSNAVLAQRGRHFRYVASVIAVALGAMDVAIFALAASAVGHHMRPQQTVTQFRGQLLSPPLAARDPFQGA
mgnify:CR=1 FL=1